MTPDLHARLLAVVDDTSGEWSPVLRTEAKAAAHELALNDPSDGAIRAALVDRIEQRTQTPAGPNDNNVLRIRLVDLAVSMGRVRLRTGGKVGRDLYLIVGDEAGDRDVPVGQVDTPELAALIFERVNAAGGKSPVGANENEGDQRD